MRHFLYFLLLLMSASLNAQYYNQQDDFLNANSVWIFGSKAGLNFNSGKATPIQTPIRILNQVASVANPISGALLFTTDGKRVWDANFQLMPNGTGLTGFTGIPAIPWDDWGLSQSVCIIPVIGSSTKYYIFSSAPVWERLIPLTYAGSLCYSVVDMSLRGGLGDVIAWQKNIPLSFDSLAGGTIAIPGNNCDIWLVKHKYRSPEFWAYHITAQGVDTKPVISTAGTQIQGDSIFNPCPTTGNVNAMVAYRGTTLIASPNRQYIALTSTTGGNGYGSSSKLAGVLLCKFNPSTGTVSDGIRITHALPPFFNPDFAVQLQATWPAFSPDNSKLYVPYAISNNDFNCPNPWGTWHHPLVQYDIGSYDSSAIARSAVTIHDFPSVDANLKLYNDTIYISQQASNSRYLHRINNPNIAGLACSFEYNAHTLFPGSFLTGSDLPNEVVYPLPPDTLFYQALDTIVCTNDNAGFRPFRISAGEGYSGYEWENGNSNRQRVINSPGIYWVLSKDACHSRVDTFSIRYVDIPFSLGKDTAVCNGQPIELRLNGLPYGTLFRWPDNSTGNTYIVNETGKYWVEVAYKGCTLTDTVNIVLADVKQDLGEDIAICKEEQIQLNLRANVPERASVLWSTGSTSAAIAITDIGTYWVQVNEPPCAGADTINIYHELCTCFTGVPNAFTPNGDETNDVFLPYIEPGCTVDQYSLHIYNRYGQRVYTSYSSSTGWDGRHNGILADAGTYFYEVSFLAGTNKERIYKKGDLALIR